MRRQWLLIFILFVVFHPKLIAQVNILNGNSIIEKQASQSNFQIIKDGVPASLLHDSNDFIGVQLAIENLKSDFDAVSGNKTGKSGTHKIIIGTVGKSELINKLITEKKIDKQQLLNKHEKYLITIVRNPINDIDEALVIAGSDKRGTIYGIYELSKQIGVSPWYFWADVPIVVQKNLFVKQGVFSEGEPAVQYRGIFLNDEAPALTNWTYKTYGGYNHKFYSKVFELLLRLKANFLWPAMWGSAFFDDDPLNGKLADEMGIVMGTSHHEPMARAQQEWQRHGNGKDWNYQTNSEGLKTFWREGFERSKNWETLTTIAMRGDGDEPMSEEQNVGLLEQIVKDQRKIIAEVTGEKPERTPQVWALYKEVQDYYDKGMRVPDDVTLLLCDDNWGNVRKLPSINDKKRKGGYGMYYHFDYVGAPRNYKWLNVTQIQRVWEQMNLTYQHGVDKIWIVNVGDLKPMEYPISFFLDMAWNPNQFNPENLLQHTEDWCAQQFGKNYAKESARLINLYTKYNHRVTPELLNDKTFSLTHYNEFETVKNDYNKLLLDAFRLYNQIPEEYRDSFDQLVLFPINGCANLYNMYYAVAMNKKLAQENNVEANYWADEVKKCYDLDSTLTVHYNQQISNGKWDHMMDQVRIGYKSWNNPPKSIMPSVVYVQSVENAKIFKEENGYVSIEAQNYHHANDGEAKFTVIPYLGKTLSGVTTLPVKAALTQDTYLEYKVDLSSIGEVKITVLTSTTLNYNKNKGLRYAISVDDMPEQIININGHYRGELGKWQATRIIESSTTHPVSKQGIHTIKIRPLEQGIVFQKILLDAGGLEPSYLGPPESKQL